MRLVFTGCQDEDLAEIRSDMRITARLIHRLPSRSLLGSSSLTRRFSANDADDMEICIRGLEHLASRDVLNSRVDEQRTVKKAVLSLQSNPMAYMYEHSPPSTVELGGDDLAREKAMLANSYANVTRSAHERALLAARADAEEAIHYLKTP